MHTDPRSFYGYAHVYESVSCTSTRNMNTLLTMPVTYKPTNVVISPFIRYSGTSAYNINTVEIVAHQRMISTAASAVVATMFVISKSIRKKMLIEKAVTDRHMIMNIRRMRKVETSLEDDSASLIQYLKKLFISFIAERFPIYCNVPST